MPFTACEAKSAGRPEPKGKGPQLRLAVFMTALAAIVAASDSLDRGEAIPLTAGYTVWWEAKLLILTDNATKVFTSYKMKQAEIACSCSGADLVSSTGSVVPLGTTTLYTSGRLGGDGNISKCTGSTRMGAVVPGYALHADVDKVYSHYSTCEGGPGLTRSALNASIAKLYLIARTGAATTRSRPTLRKEYRVCLADSTEGTKECVTVGAKGTNVFCSLDYCSFTDHEERLTVATINSPSNSTVLLARKYVVCRNWDVEGEHWCTLTDAHTEPEYQGWTRTGQALLGALKSTYQLPSDFVPTMTHEPATGVNFSALCRDSQRQADDMPDLADSESTLVVLTTIKQHLLNNMTSQTITETAAFMSGDWACVDRVSDATTADKTAVSKLSRSYDIAGQCLAGDSGSGTIEIVNSVPGDGMYGAPSTPAPTDVPTTAPVGPGPSEQSELGSEAEPTPAPVTTAPSTGVPVLTMAPTPPTSRPVATKAPAASTGLSGLELGLIIGGAAVAFGTLVACAVKATEKVRGGGGHEPNRYQV